MFGCLFKIPDTRPSDNLSALTRINSKLFLWKMFFYNANEWWTCDNRDLVLQNDVENIMAVTYEQPGSFK